MAKRRTPKDEIEVTTEGTHDVSEVPDNALIKLDDGSGRSSEEIQQEQEEAKKEADRLLAIRERFQVHQTHWTPIFNRALEDDKFVAGEHWPENIRQDREDESRPCLTFNMFPSFIRQITNRIRQERPAAKVEPVEKDKNAPRFDNVEGTKDYSAAEVYTGMLRNIEHVSKAEQAYDTALKHACDHGFGWFYMINQWSALDPFVQELAIKRVKNAYSITLAPEAEEADLRDAQDGFMWRKMNVEVFKKRYPGVAYTAMGDSTGLYEGWYTKEDVRICQYFYIAYKDDKVLKLSNGKVVYLSEVESILDELEEKYGVHVVETGTGSNKKRLEKAVKRPVCMWMKCTADKILEEVELPFSRVPIFFVSGEEVMVDGQVRYESAIRHALDAAKSYNYWRTAAAETVALAPKAPWVGTERMFEGHEAEWETANEKNHPYLAYNPDPRAPGAKPERNFPQAVAAAELSNAQQDAMDMQTIIGLHDANLGRESNEKSGKAIIARQNQGAASTYHFPDNLSRAIENCTELAVEAIPRLYDTPRAMRIRMPDDTSDFVMINEPVQDDDTGDVILMRDITVGRYDVVMDASPSYQTMRQEAADLQMELLRVLGPDQARNIVHLIVQNMGVPGSDEVASVLRKMLPDFLKTEDERLADLPKGVKFDEGGNMVNEDGTPYQPPITPELQAQMEEQATRKAEAEAKTAKANADTAKAQASVEVEKTKQKTADLKLAEVQRDLQAGGQSDLEAIHGAASKAVEDMLGDGLDQRLAAFEGSQQEKIEQLSVELLKRVRAYVDKAIRERMATPAPQDTQPAAVQGA